MAMHMVLRAACQMSGTTGAAAGCGTKPASRCFISSMTLQAFVSSLRHRSRRCDMYVHVGSAHSESSEFFLVLMRSCNVQVRMLQVLLGHVQLSAQHLIQHATPTPCVDRVRVAAVLPLRIRRIQQLRRPVPDNPHAKTKMSRSEKLERASKRLRQNGIRERNMQCTISHTNE